MGVGTTISGSCESGDDEFPSFVLEIEDGVSEGDGCLAVELEIESRRTRCFGARWLWLASLVIVSELDQWFRCGARLDVMRCISITELTTERSSGELDPSPLCAKVFSDEGEPRRLSVTERQSENHSVRTRKSPAGGRPCLSAVALTTFRKRSSSLCLF